MRTRIALVLSSLTALAVLAPSAVQAAVEPPVAYNADPAHYVTVLTHGFGHGIGLSQYGAKGRADGVGGPKQNAQQILGFYYPGTTRGAGTGQVRVWITEDSDANTIVRPAKGLRVVDLGNGKSHLLPLKKGATAWRLTVVGGKTRVAWLKAGTWHFYRPGGKLLVGSGEFRASSNTLTLFYGGANHPYRGAMRLVAGRTINVVSLDNYLKGVVPAEMPALWAGEALKAQAVAARTYAAFERVEYASRSFQVYDTTQSQVYKGIAVEQPQSTAAVAATSGWILLYQGKPAFTQFSASNGGITAKPGNPTPYLVGGRPDPYDQYPTSDPQLGPITKGKLQKAYPTIGSLTSVQVQQRDTDNRVLKVKLVGTSGTVMIKGTDLRSIMGLRSTYFSFAAG